MKRGPTGTDADRTAYEAALYGASGPSDRSRRVFFNWASAAALSATVSSASRKHNENGREQQRQRVVRKAARSLEAPTMGFPARALKHPCRCPNRVGLFSFRGLPLRWQPLALSSGENSDIALEVLLDVWIRGASTRRY